MAVVFQSEIRNPKSSILLVACQAFLLLVAAFAQSGDDASVRAQRQLDALFDDPAFARGFWGVMARSLDTGEVLYRRNADKYLMPASNMKLVTAIAAIEKLLAFSMIANNFTQSSKTADYVQDSALEYLANFSRKSDGILSTAGSSNTEIALFLRALQVP